MVISDLGHSMKFSERIGVVRRVIQKDSMDEALKNELWNLAYGAFWKKLSTDPQNSLSNLEEGRLLAALWGHHFCQPLDLLGEYCPVAFELLREKYTASDWASVYDFMEFIVGSEILTGWQLKEQFIQACNAILERHLSAYRIVGTTLVPITSEQEIADIERGLSHTGRFALAPLADTNS